MNNETYYNLSLINSERCKPQKCRQECRTKCPVVRIGKNCVQIISSQSSSIATIDDKLCIRCGICEKVIIYLFIQF